MGRLQVGLIGLEETSFTPRLLSGRPSQAITAYRCEYGLVLHREIPYGPPPWCACSFKGLGWCISDPVSGLRVVGPLNSAIDIRRELMAAVARVAEVKALSPEAVIEEKLAMAARMVAIDQAALDEGVVLTALQIAMLMAEVPAMLTAGEPA
jgi:hypothetical protein